MDGPHPGLVAVDDLAKYAERSYLDQRWDCTSCGMKWLRDLADERGSWEPR